MSRKMILGSLASLFIVGVAVTATVFGTQSQAAWNGEDCSDNAIIKCGAHSRSELHKEVSNSTELRKLYAHFGISSEMIKSGTIKEGVVTESAGEVIVDGEVVATDVKSVGRYSLGYPSQENEFKVDGKTYHSRDTSHPNTFVLNSGRTIDMSAFVFFDKHGNYVSAILKSCGNPVFSESKKPKKKPAAECEDLKVGITDRNRYRLTADASTEDGAEIKSYSYVITNTDTGETVLNKTTDSSSIRGELPAGSYEAKVTVNTSVGKKTNKHCVESFTIKKKPAAECESLKATITDRNQYRFTAKSEASHGAEVESYRYVVTNTATDETVLDETVETSSDSSSISGELPAGSYEAEVIVNTTVGEKTNNNCVETFTIKKKPAAQCESLKVAITDRNQYRFTANSEASHGAEVESYRYIVTDTASGETVLDQAVETSSDSSSISGQLPAGSYEAEVIVKTTAGDKTNQNCVEAFTVEQPPAKEIEVCELDSNQIITIKEDEFNAEKHSMDLQDCEEEPEVPTELPQTGVGGVASVVGAGSLVTSLSYYAASRRGLLSALLQR